MKNQKIPGLWSQSYEFLIYDYNARVVEGRRF
jgi:hypothetical protein